MIYFDNASTTKIDSAVDRTVSETAKRYYSNPSSSHQAGQKARKIIEDSRAVIANHLGCLPEEIIFTGSGSEANNLALQGLVQSLKDSSKKPEIEIITSQIEHKSILKTASYLEKLTGVIVRYIKPNSNGQIEVDDVIKAVRKQTRLISIIYTNNETGVIQPISEIGQAIAKINQKRPNEDRIYFHTDAVQAVEYQLIDLKKSPIDLLSSSGHKYHGPKGIGFLYQRLGTPLKPIIFGGGQERELRSGTENTPAIAGLAKAIEQFSAQKTRKVEKTRKLFESLISNNITNIKINGEKVARSPHISSIVFPGAEGESIMLALDLEKVAVSTGSACNASDLKASHVLTAQGLKPEEAQSTVRFSFSSNNTLQEAKEVVSLLKKIIPKLRSISVKL